MCIIAGYTSASAKIICNKEQYTMKINVIPALLCGIGMFLSLFVVLSSCSERTMSVYNDIPLELGNKNARSFTDVFCDFELIRLDDKEKAQLSQIRKLVVTDKGLYFLEFREPDVIQHFGHDGKYLGRIGEYGKARTEYINIFNFTANERGDTIVALDYRRAIYYNDKGEYIMALSFDEFFDDILLLPQGLLTANYHHNSDKLFSLYDTTGKIDSFVELTSGLIRGSNFSQNYLQRYGDRVCYYDFFSSRFYLMDINELSAPKCYELRADDMLTETKAKELKGRVIDCAFVNSYVMDDSTVIGDMLIDKYRCDFRIDLNNDNMELIKFDKYVCKFDYYCKGYYYQVLSPTYIKEVITHPSRAKTYEMLKEVLKPYEDSISEKDNYYILRMRRKL